MIDGECTLVHAWAFNVMMNGTVENVKNASNELSTEDGDGSSKGGGFIVSFL